MIALADGPNLYEMACSFPKFLEECGKFYGFNVPQLHLRMAEDMQHGHESIAISAFRNAGKSYVCELYIAWRLWLEPRMWILVAAATKDLSTAIVGEVENHLNMIPWLRHLAPEKRTSSEFWVKGVARTKWPSLQGITGAGNLRGLRCDLLVLDDILPSSKKHSQTIRNRILGELEANGPQVTNEPGRFFVADGLDIPDYANTRTVSLFTPTDRKPNNFYQAEDGNYWNRFVVKRYPALVESEDDEVSAWPERFSTGLLLDEREANEFAFSIERMVDDSPIEDENSLIRVSKVPEKTIKNVELTAFVDPSAGGDEYVAALGGMHKEPAGTSIYVHALQAWQGLPTDEASLALVHWLRDRGVKRVRIEDNHGTSGILRTVSKEQGYPLIIDTFKSTTNKERRLKEVLPTMLNSGKVIFNETILSQKETLLQLRGLRASSGLPARDDRIDCLEFLISHYKDRVVHRNPDRKGPRWAPLQ